MGYGLVAVPRQLWRIANIKGAEGASFHKAGLQADRAIAAKKCGTAWSVSCCLANIALWLGTLYVITHVLAFGLLFCGVAYLRSLPPCDLAEL